MVQLLFTPDGAAWANTDVLVPGIDQGSIVDGIIESGGTVVFVGRDVSGGGGAWTVEGSSIK